MLTRKIKELEFDEELDWLDDSSTQATKIYMKLLSVSFDAANLEKLAKTCRFRSVFPISVKLTAVTFESVRPAEFD